ncbi:MAG: hypothetical protein JW384_01040 [Nitrosomonadaceae bacterium]|nr:hypothetical protein [Nitrosomonadaceae bacterium]
MKLKYKITNPILGHNGDLTDTECEKVLDFCQESKYNHTYFHQGLPITTAEFLRKASDAPAQKRKQQKTSMGNNPFHTLQTDGDDDDDDMGRVKERGEGAMDEGK